MKSQITMRNNCTVSLAFALLLLCPIQMLSQHKQLWAKSFLNKKAPELNIKTWLTEAPDTKGKFILLDFWATWCAPCRKGIPKLNGYSKEFEGDLIVIGVSKESAEKVRQMKRPKIDYYSALDLNNRLNTIFQIEGIPHVVLIDPNGVVRWEGFPSLTGHELTTNVIRSFISDYKSQD